MKVVFAVMIFIVLGQTTPPRLRVSGSFKGVAKMRFEGQWMELPYEQYNDLSIRQHIDFVTIPHLGRMMLGAYVKNIAYLMTPSGCLSFEGEPFPFPSDLLFERNATMVGNGTITIANSSSVSHISQWSILIPTMGRTWPVDFFLELGTNALVRAVFIGGGEDGTSTVFDMVSWDTAAPPHSVFTLPSMCQKSIRSSPAAR